LVAYFALGAARFVAAFVVFLAAVRAFVLVRLAAVVTLSGRVAEALLFFGPLGEPARICFETALPSLFSSDLSPLRAFLASVLARFELLVLATILPYPLAWHLTQVHV
jgi:hypothetical protein